MKKNKIVVIDDSSINRMFIKTIIEENLPKFEVFEAENGMEGFKLCKEEKPNVILLDIMMPELDGYEVCKMLKKEESTKRIPVIFLSALTDAEDKAKGFDVGGIDYITKPSEIKEVIARINTHAGLYNVQNELREYIKKVNEDLLMAQKVQIEMLPKTKKVDGLSMDWCFKPSFNVSGDMFGLIPIESGAIFYVIDVSGHGAASAMLSLLIKQQIENLVSTGITDLKILGKKLDDGKFFNLSDGAYFTAIFVKIENNKANICNFGHREPLLISDKIKVINEGNFPLGMNLINEEEIVEKIYDFQKDDIILLYTDGLIEAVNENNKEFTMEMIIKLIKNIQEKTPKIIINKIKEEFEHFIESKKPDDDITIFAVKKEI
ncbi:transcriptional regulator [Tepiditoga spiralis]|uniref:Transcriptional regulator n=1 Tax=Tepiditoga spiralis TaxID=2108365 RepID=A0A7G1G8J7_9BACT|nr:fused response regulator/phosphatase [Tepiditoga spiralis]BBE30362.1 transcriptional regulator [Tepiditoga spiralis]